MDTRDLGKGYYIRLVNWIGRRHGRSDDHQNALYLLWTNRDEDSASARGAKEEDQHLISAGGSRVPLAGYDRKGSSHITDTS